MKTDLGKITAWDRIMMAITFAEAGETGTAIAMLNRKSSEKRQGARPIKKEQRPELRL